MNPTAEGFPRAAAAFGEQEYRARLRRCRDAMAASGVDCLLVSNAENICYLTGYAADSSYIAQALAVPAADELPTLYLRRMDAPAGRYFAWLPADRVVAYPESFIGRHDANGFDWMFARLRERGDVRRLGLEFSAIPGGVLDRLRGRYREYEYCDLSDALLRARLVKSPAEIAVMREAAVGTDLAMQCAVDVIRPGIRECDAAAEITATLIRGTPECPGERGSAILMPGGAQSGTAHINWTGQAIEAGRHYNVELSAYRFRYAAPLMRTVTVGPPGAKLRRLQDHMIEGCDAALAAAKPGATCGDVARAFCAVVERGGYAKDSRCGYPIGIHWLETSCSLRTDDPTVLQTGMAFHLMLGMWIEEDFGAILSESFHVTRDAAEVFSRVRRDLLLAGSGSVLRAAPG